MTDHTPAPWNDDDIHGNIYHEDYNRRIPVVEGCDDGKGIWVHNEADRDLILAAPDMYEALDSAKALLDVRNDYGVVYADICDALKKARGEQ